MDRIEKVIIVLPLAIAIATFLINTRRILKAIELLKECLYIVSNMCKAMGKENDFIKTMFIIIYNRMLCGYELLSDHTSAIKWGRKMLVLLRESGRRYLEGRVSLKLGHLYKRQSKLEKAKECYMNALRITAETRDKELERACYGNLGTVFYFLSKYDKAAEYFRKSLQINIEIGDRQGEAADIANLGNVFNSLGKYGKAEKCLQKALEIMIETGDKQGKAAVYGNLGKVFQSLGKYDKAKEYLRKALKIYIEIGDKQGEASVYDNLGNVFRYFGKYEQAKKYLQKALKIYIEIGDKQGEASVYGNLGTVFHFFGQYDKAKEYLQEALKIRIEVGDKNGEAADYGDLGSVFQSLGKYEQAKEYLQKALKIRIEIGDKRGEAADYRKLGNVLESVGKYEKAEEYLQKALKFHIEIGYKQGEAEDYRSLGTVFRSLGKYDKAEECLQKALKIAIEIGDKQDEAADYADLGTVFQYLGKHEQAKEYLHKALKIRIEIGDKQGEASDYGNLGNVFQSHGKYDKAEEYIQKALEIQIEIGDKRGEAAAYTNLGTVSYSLGKYGKAEEYLQKALKIQIEIGNKEGVAWVYGIRGILLKSLGKYDQAEENLKRALKIRIEIGDKLGEAADYGSLGNVFQSLGKYDEAEECLQKALKIRIEIGNKQGEAKAYRGLGTVFQSLGKYDKAEECLQKTLKILIEIGNKEGEAEVYVNLGSFYFSLSEYARAKGYYEEALSLAQTMGHIEEEFTSNLNLALLTLILTGDIREVVSGLIKSIEKSEEMQAFLKGNDDFKISSLDLHISPYKMLISLFSIIGKFNEALYVAELSRAKALADMMSAKYCVEQEISVNPQSWVGIERIMRKEIDSVCLFVSYLNEDLFLWIIKANRQLLFRQKNVNDCFSENRSSRIVDEVFGDISLRNFVPLLTQGHCEDRSLFPSRGSCFASSRPVVEDGNEDQNSEQLSLTQCYKMIIDPVVDLLDQPEIIIVPEGPLYKVPFAAFKGENEEYLSQSFRIRIVPSLTTLKLILDSPADYHIQTGALIVGDPEVGNVIYKGRDERIRPLPCAREEAEMIGRLLGVKPLIGEHATKEAVLSDIHAVSLIHFAAHGDAERGEIALAPPRPFNDTPQEKDYLLTMAEISQVRLRAKLVVLSCCHSAKGEIRSEGVVGIARAFLGCGARSVLVTLWAIEDEATMELMNHFYEHLVDGVSASESLHEAMKWMRSNGYSHVEQWAPFMLIGDNVTFDFRK